MLAFLHHRTTAPAFDKRLAHHLPAQDFHLARRLCIRAADFGGDFASAAIPRSLPGNDFPLGNNTLTFEPCSLMKNAFKMSEEFWRSEHSGHFQPPTLAENFPRVKKFCLFSFAF
jgi:hypothetical protein